MKQQQSVATKTQPELERFVQRLKADQADIDKDIQEFAAQLSSYVNERFGEPASNSVGAYIAILTRGGKRVRGSLALEAYRAYGGSSRQDGMILARVLELIHAYLLVLDDIQDNSSVRRGGPTAHEIVADYHKKGYYRGNPRHFGNAQATNGALVGAHQAMIELLKIKSPRTDELIKHLNETLVATAMGQFYDNYNEVVETVNEAYVLNALEWKTAHYTISNPLYMGAMLAGAPDEDLDVMSEFGKHAGLAFQMSDDILCTFSDEQESGKPPMDDIREGKRTILVLRTLQLANKADAVFFEHMLGNEHISEAQFEHCRKIIVESGGLNAAREILDDSCKLAKEVVERSALPDSLKEYLYGLADFLATRKK